MDKFKYEFSFPLFTKLIHRIEESTLLIEKEYSILKKEEEKNKRLNAKLKEINKSLKNKLVEKEREIKDIYENIALKEKQVHRKEVFNLEKRIAGGFSHKLKNLYYPVLLFFDKVFRDDLLGKIDLLFIEILKILKKELNRKNFEEVLPLFERLNNNNLKMIEIFKFTEKILKKNISLIEDFLNYSNTSLRLSEVSIKNLILSVIRNNQDLLNTYRIKVKMELNSQGIVNGDFNQFYLVFQNLIINSINALKNFNRKNKEIRIKLYRNKNDTKTIVEISDNGPVIGKDVLDKVFKPFFTTHKKDGTGLGLPLCKRIIEEHKGTIVIMNNKNGGATVKISFPKRSRKE